jgi:hypothetical protein
VLLVCVLTPAALVAGCGGGSSNTTSTGATSGLSIATVKKLNKANTAKSYALCQEAASNPGLPPDQKALVNTECGYIRTGNNRGLHAVDRQLCELQAAQLPDPQRTRMRAQCKTL